MTNKIDISVIIPVYNEEESIKPLFDEISKAIDDNYSYEIIFIDDGSNDTSKKNNFRIS